MTDIRICDLPDYPGNDLATGWMDPNVAYNIPPGTIIKGDPIGPTYQKYVHTYGNYQVVCRSNPVKSPIYVRFVVDSELTDWYIEDSDNIIQFVNLLNRDSNFKIRESNMEQKRTVVFNEGGLSFSVDGVEIRNGRYPEEIKVEGTFQIEGESLAKLMVELKDNLICIEKKDLLKLCYNPSDNVSKCTYSIYSNQNNGGAEIVNEILENRITELEEERVELEKEKKRLRDRFNLKDQELFHLKEILHAHNELSPLKRMKKIKYTD